jgi:TATA-box binding protein (TBP) (component of TFIID and TFIIIB)
MLPRVTNICGSFNCGCNLNLKELYYINYNELPIKYIPCNFPGIRAKFLNSKTTALIFSNGHIGIVGARTIGHFKKGVKEITYFLIKNNYVPKVKNVMINNICGALTLAPLDLTNLSKNNLSIASYETELFPAVKFNLDGKIFTIHHSGKVFSTGYKSIEEMNMYFELLYCIIEDYIKKTNKKTTD